MNAPAETASPKTASDVASKLSADAMQIAAPKVMVSQIGQKALIGLTLEIVNGMSSL